MEYKIFVNHSSAGEVGTSSASINRTGKTNAAKGAENHFNEYSEFHARETEAHILASFMEMTGMKDTGGMYIFYIDYYKVLDRKRQYPINYDMLHKMFVSKKTQASRLTLNLIALQ